ncbi:hypothetical protein STAS_04633 [Striga asiatica]|uniref:Uncharacterized protein n=1 Tax=Striga asiatica TaxID=4170 RepID=A0A5A7P827_STRAF|nr:hypothetical protein STAS_04633 [Striga asiatica]
MEPFGKLRVDLSPWELRETAYEILIGACRSSGSTKRLKYVSNSTNSRERSSQLSSSPSMHSALSSCESKLKKALGLKPKNKKSEEEEEPGSEGQGNSGRRRIGVIGGELMRVQMRISEQTDSRVRRGLLRVAAGQLGRRIESIVLPLELLQQLRSSDFNNQKEYEAWQKRNLKVLEAGLLVHPYLPPDKSDTAPERLRQLLYTASEKPFDTGKHSESMNVLRNLVTSITYRSFDGFVADMCHWADGVPLNLHLYRILLEACFDVNDETSIIEEVDEVLDQIKKTWGVFGIDQVFHNLCFLWVLFHKYITTGEIEGDLLVAADHMMVEVEKDASSTRDVEYSKILASILHVMLDWAEGKLQRYHDIFYRDNISVMKSVLSLAVSAAKILDMSHKYVAELTLFLTLLLSDFHTPWKLNGQLHRLCFLLVRQEREKLFSKKKFSKNRQSSLPLLSILAQNICDLVFNEKEIYSPVLKIWNPLATAIAVATLHACFAEELKQFVSGVSELNPEAIQVLLAAEKLEKDLVEMAVADSLDSEDGGKATIQEMIPYEAQTVIRNFVKSWIQTRVDRLEDWVNRSLQQEVEMQKNRICCQPATFSPGVILFLSLLLSYAVDWNPEVNKGRFAASAVEVLRILNETLEAFFLLPIPMHPVLLPELMGGLDTCLKNYITKAISGCGSRVAYIPALPPLTRCTVGSKLSAFKRKDRLLTSPSRNKSLSAIRNGDDPLSLPRLCLRINTLYNIRKETEAIEKKTISNLKKSGYADDEKSANKILGLSVALSLEGVRQLSEATAYRAVFHDLRHVLGDHLYVGGISSSQRIEPFLDELERKLEVVSVMVHDRVRTRVITDIMKASFEGFMLVLLAGGPARAFSTQDAAVIEEDFKLLSSLFWSNGDGLPVDIIEKLSPTVFGVISLLQTGTDRLVEQLKQMMMTGAGNNTRLPLPPTTGQWGPADPNTILRVLCNRNDKTASQFLKKAYGLPKNT